MSETSSASVTRTANGSHEFRVTGYPLSKGLGVGKHVPSGSFSVGGHEWAVYFYPDGKSPEDGAAYVSPFVALASEGADGRARALRADADGPEREGPACGAISVFFKRTALEASDYLREDCLSVNCSVGVVTSLTEGPKTYSIPVPPSNISEHFGQLLECGKGTDVVLKLTERFLLHTS